MTGNFVAARTSRKAIYLMILCTIFTSLGQVLWKLGVIKVDFNFPLTVLNIPFLLGFVSYGVGALLMLLAFKEGELSILYLVVATSYVWVSLLSPWIFPTDFMNSWKWAGVIIILLAVSLLGFGSSRINKIKVVTDG